MGEKLVLIIADEKSAWRDRLVAGLEEDPRHEVRIIEDAQALYEAMMSPLWPTGIVIGTGLHNGSGIEAALRAARELGSEEEPKMPSCVFLITEVRADEEYLELLRKRGVADFVYREDALETTLTHLANGIHSESRVEKRFPVSLTVDLLFPDSDTRVEATLENVSSRGAKVVVAKKKHAEKLAVGDRIEIEITSEMRVPATVRATMQRHKGVALGVQFEIADEKVLQTVLNICESELTSQMGTFTSWT